MLFMYDRTACDSGSPGVNRSTGQPFDRPYWHTGDWPNEQPAGPLSARQCQQRERRRRAFSEFSGRATWQTAVHRAAKHMPRGRLSHGTRRRLSSGSESRELFIPRSGGVLRKQLFFDTALGIVTSIDGIDICPLQRLLPSNQHRPQPARTTNIRSSVNSRPQPSVATTSLRRACTFQH